MTRSRVEIVWETWALMRRMKRTEEERTRVSPITETNVSVEFTEEEVSNLCRSLLLHFRSYLQDEKENMKLSLSDLQQQTRNLRSNIQDEEARLKVIRTKEIDQRESYTGELLKAYRACCVNIQCLTKSEGEKRGKLEAEVKRLTGNLESEKAKRMKFESDVKLSEQNLEREKMKRVELEDGAKLFEQNLELERSKLLCIICEERVRDTL